MNRDVRGFTDLASFFEQYFKEITDHVNRMNSAIDRFNGWCNCCFLLRNGNFYEYRYSDGEIVRLFICTTCRGLNCHPEGICNAEGSCFAGTHEKYVTSQNKK